MSAAAASTTSSSSSSGSEVGPAPKTETKPSDQKDKKKIYVAFDIEMGGHRFSHPCVAVGVCYGDGETNKKKRWCIDVDRHEFDERCEQEFWKHNEILLSELQAAAYEHRAVWNDVADFIDQLETEYPEDQNKIVFVSDNPAFDIAHIDYNLHKHANRAPLRYTTEGKYRSIEDPSEQQRFFPFKEQMHAYVAGRGAVHSHYPEQDAEVMLLQQYYMDNHEKLSKADE